MSLAALGCNPEDHGANLSDIGGHALGTLAFSPAGGIYVAIRANGAITANVACALSPSFDVATVNTGDPQGTSYCVPQVGLADNDYGWALIAGRGQVRTTGAVTEADGRAASIQANGVMEDRDGTDDIAGFLLTANTATGTRNNGCFLMFPKKIN